MIAEACLELSGETRYGGGRPRCGPVLMLASRSPRRRMLLDQAGVPHEAVHPGFEDADLQPGNVPPDQWVMSLAYLKAWTRARQAQQGRFVLGADTTCVVDGKMLGTPRTEAEAHDMIGRFVGRSHEVLTGVAIVRAGSSFRRMFVDRAVVTFGALSDQSIREYVSSGAWQGKAGAYNLAERVEAGWPITFDGDPSTVMGLPMRKLMPELESLREQPH